MFKYDFSKVSPSGGELAKTVAQMMTDPFRFEHTLSVEKECSALAEIFSLSSEDAKRLSTAALLHDIAKGLSLEEYLALDKKYSIGFTKDDLESPAVLHAKAGAAIAQNEFSYICDETVITAIRQHTTGDENMSLISKLLFLADYIEVGRRWESCKTARERFYSNVEASDDKIRVLDETLLEILESTEEHLSESGKKVHPDAARCKDFILKAIE